MINEEADPSFLGCWYRRQYPTHELSGVQSGSLTGASFSGDLYRERYPKIHGFSLWYEHELISTFWLPLLQRRSIPARTGGEIRLSKR